jgi:hypothetical protein
MKISFKGIFGILIVLVLLVHYSTQVYNNSLIEKGDTVNKELNKFNMACNIIILCVILLAFGSYIFKIVSKLRQ